MKNTNQNINTLIHELEEINKRNSLRVLECIKNMGTKYVFHESNKVTKNKIKKKVKNKKAV